MTKTMKLLLISVALSLSSNAFAQVYKCKNANQKITYQSSPCTGVPGEKVFILPGPSAEQLMIEQAKNAERQASIAKEREAERLVSEERQRRYDQKVQAEKIENEKKQELIKKMEAERIEEIRRQEAARLERYKLHLMERQAVAAEQAAIAAQNAASAARAAQDGASITGQSQQIPNKSFTDCRNDGFGNLKCHSY